LISRVTLYSLLLSLMLGLGIRLSDARHPDNCTLYNAGDRSVSSSVLVAAGTRQIEVPCNDWIMRQSLNIQMLCLVDLIIGVVFFFNALSDFQQFLQMRRRMRGTS
jgi:hypothetical protein